MSSSTSLSWWHRHGAFVATAVFCIATFTWMLTYGTWQLITEDSFGTFYDYQARAWLHGRWDVPEPALGGEAFVVDGKVYGYFGPTPALMRLPFVAAGIGFGKLTRAFMLLDYMACLLAAYLILREAVRRRRRKLESGHKAPPTAAGVEEHGKGSGREEGRSVELGHPSERKAPPAAEGTEEQAAGSRREGFAVGSFDACSDVRPASDPDVARWLVVALLVTVGLGSTLFFLASRAYVYHEAILCGAALTLWSVWCALRHDAAPESRWWVGAVACGVLAVQARPPSGLFALTFVAVVALANAWRKRWEGGAGSKEHGAGATAEARTADTRSCGSRRWLRHVAIAIMAMVGVLSFNAISYVKFGTWEGCPLRYNVQYPPERLATIEGRNFHLGNLRFNSDAYLRCPSASLRPTFPYVFVEYIDRKQYPESRMAYRDPTLAIPYAMPALVFLAVVGSMAVAVRANGRCPGAMRPPARPIALLWLAAIPLGGAMLTAVAVTQRYTADFCAFLVPTAALGALALVPASRRARAATAAIIFVLAVIGAGVQGAITLHHQRAVSWGVPEEARRQYAEWQQQIDDWFERRARPR